MRIAIAQINTTVGDFSGNLNKILGSFDEARKKSVEFLVLPEMAICGYPPEDALFNSDFVTAGLKALYRLSEQSRGICAAVGFVERDKSNRLYNSTALIFNGKVRAVYRKIELPNYGVFDEKRYFCSGEEGLLLSLGQENIKAALSICEDIWIPQNFIFKKPYCSEADILINISASPFSEGKIAVRQRITKKVAVHNHVYVIYANLVGGQDELVFDGGSFVMSPKGVVVARARSFEEDFLVFDLPQIRKKKIVGARFDQFPCKRVILPGIKKNNRAFDKLAEAPIDKPLIKMKRKPGEDVYSALVLGARDYVIKNSFKKVVMGISGGIDSALVACVAVDAVGASNVVGVTMPSIYTSQETLADSKLLAHHLDIEFFTIGINSIYQKYLAVLKNIFTSSVEGVAEENLQARIRGNILMALSNKFNYLVLTTGNKSEMATGYCTLYGDMAGGFAVIKDVPKTMVYTLSKYVNQKSGFDLIPKSIIGRAPSAELRFNQKDQDSLPEYPVLDLILKKYIEKNDASYQYSDKRISNSLVKDIIRKVDANEYKRRQAPPGIKITPLAFGRDRRMPITNRFGR